MDFSAWLPSPFSAGPPASPGPPPTTPHGTCHFCTCILSPFPECAPHSHLWGVVNTLLWPRTTIWQPAPDKLLLTSQDPTQMSHFSCATSSRLSCSYLWGTSDMLSFHGSSLFLYLFHIQPWVPQRESFLIFAAPRPGATARQGQTLSKYFMIEGTNTNKKAESFEWEDCALCLKFSKFILHTFSRKLFLRDIFVLF